MCVLADSSGRAEKSAGLTKGKKGKDGKDSRSGKNQSGSRPASQVKCWGLGWLLEGGGLIEGPIRGGCLIEGVLLEGVNRGNAVNDLIFIYSNNNLITQNQTGL